MTPRQFMLVLAATVLAIATLYAPQPLLGVMRDSLGVTTTSASLLITATLLPLGFAPILYGHLLESVPARRLLLVSFCGLAASQLGLALAESYPVVLGLRFAQGLIVPAALTSLMTYVSRTSGESVQQAMAAYIGATIFGGFFGRLAGGFLAWLFGDWHAPFYFLFIAQLATAAALLRLAPDKEPAFPRLDVRTALRVLAKPEFLRVYLIVFLCFFTFASMLNFLPFRLERLDPAISPFSIALVYSGYLSGILVSILAMRLVRTLGSEKAAVTAGIAVFILGTAALAAPSALWCLAAMFVFCAGMFLTHSVAPGHLNRLAGGNKGVVNGLYISFYYLGGTLGSYLPGFLYRSLGWNVYVLFLCCVLGAALILAVGMRNRRDRAGAPPPAGG